MRWWHANSHASELVQLSDALNAYGILGTHGQAAYVIRTGGYIGWLNRCIDVAGCRAFLDWFTGHKRRG